MGARSKLTADDKAFIVERLELRALTQQALADKFSVSTQTIGGVYRDYKIERKAGASPRQSSRGVVEILKADIEKDKKTLSDLNQLRTEIRNLEQLIQRKEQALQLLQENQLNPQIEGSENDKGEMRNEDNQ